MTRAFRPDTIFGFLGSFFGWIFSILATGCNGYFYWPSDEVYYTPDQLAARCEDVYFDSLDGTRLHGWFLHHTSAGPARGTVVHYHGNALNVSYMVRFVEWLPAEGFDVFLFDYRGYGESEGKPNRAGIHLDGRAALDYVRGRRDVDPTRLLVFGQSLGGAVALAALGEGDRTGVRGVAVEATFTSYRAVGNRVLGGTFLTYPLACLLVSNAHSPVHSIEEISPIPLLVVHGERDAVVPVSLGRDLFEAAREPKEFWLLEEGGHGDTFLTFGAIYRPRLVEFFERCLDEPPPTGL